MNGTLLRPSWPVTNRAPSTAKARAAPGIMTRVNRRRPTRSTMDSPTIIMIRYVSPSPTLTRSAADVVKPLSVRMVGV